MECHWFQQSLSPSGEILFLYSRQNRYHWLRFPELADFRISLGGKEIICYPQPKIPQVTIQHLLLDQVLPRCFAHQGRLMVHASAVQIGKGLLLIIGDSGVGKSTLAGNFHQAGQLALSDDCIQLKEEDNQILGVPSYGGLRLWEDSLDALFTGEQLIKSMAHYSMKKRVSLGEPDMHEFQQELPVLAVIALSLPGEDPVSDIIVEPLFRREAFIALVKQSFQLDVMDMKRMTRHVQAMGRVVPRLPAYRLSMPHDYALLPLVRQKILETVM